MGVAMAGGTPVVFPAIAVCDGIAMGHIGMKYSLVTRDLIADSTEAMALAHQFDALVMVPNCDKNVPGLLMAAARINVPTVFVSGGPMLGGHVKGQKRSLSSMFEAVGSYAAGIMTAELSLIHIFAYNAYSWLFLIGYRQPVKIPDHGPADLLIFRVRQLGAADEVCADLFPFLVQAVGRTFHFLVGAHPVDTFHQYISKYSRIDHTHGQLRRDLEAWVALQTAQVQRDDRNVGHICFLQCSAYESDVVGSPASSAGLGHDDCGLM